MSFYNIVPVEWRHHMEILEGEGDQVGRKIEHRGDLEPPFVEFLD